MPSTLTERERLASLIRPIRIALFTTRHENGHLHARPMTVQNRTIDEDEALWFFMSRGSEPVADLLRVPAVNVGFADPDHDRYVSVSGSARLVEDRAKARALWSPLADAWFPEGPDDRDLAVVRVDIVHAEYWDVQASKPVQLFRMLKAAATGRRMAALGRQGQLRME